MTMTKLSKFIMEGLAVAVIMAFIFFVIQEARRERDERKWHFIYDHSRIPGADSTDSI